MRVWRRIINAMLFFVKDGVFRIGVNVLLFWQVFCEQDTTGLGDNIIIIYHHWLI